MACLNLPVTVVCPYENADLETIEIGARGSLTDMVMEFDIGNGAIQYSPEHCHTNKWAHLARACRSGGAYRVNFGRGATIAVEASVVTLQLTRFDGGVTIRICAAACGPAFEAAANHQLELDGIVAQRFDALCSEMALGDHDGADDNERNDTKDKEDISITTQAVKFINL